MIAAGADVDAKDEVRTLHLLYVWGGVTGLVLVSPSTMRVTCAGWQVSNGTRDGSSLEASAGRKCVLCGVCGVGIALSFIPFCVLLCRPSGCVRGVLLPWHWVEVSGVI